MTVTIKPLTEREFFGWYELFTAYSAVIGIDPDDERAMRVWTGLQTPGTHGIIAVDEQGDTVGIAHYSSFHRLLHGDSGYVIEDLYVADGSRRNGVASALVEYVRSEAERKHHGSVRWVTRAGEDAATTALQQKFQAAAGDWVLHEMPIS